MWSNQFRLPNFWLTSDFISMWPYPAIILTILKHITKEFITEEIHTYQRLHIDVALSSNNSCHPSAYHQRIHNQENSHLPATSYVALSSDNSCYPSAYHQKIHNQKKVTLTSNFISMWPYPAIILAILKHITKEYITKKIHTYQLLHNDAALSSDNSRYP